MTDKTEYYDVQNDSYFRALKGSILLVRWKLEFLTHGESAIGMIYNISTGDSGQLSISKNQGIRRSCSLSISNQNAEELPTYNSTFWHNRKFKIYLGIETSSSIYWFSQGVFVTTSADSDRTTKSLMISASDKFAFWDGSINLRMTTESYKIYGGSYLGDSIRQTLLLRMSGESGLPIDPIEPIIDMSLEDIALNSDITINAGSYFGDYFTELATMYYLNVYYDVMGRLNFQLEKDYNSFYTEHVFSDENTQYYNATTNYGYDGINSITVSTDHSDSENYTYTAVNENPMSPINIYSGIGLKTQDVITVSLPDANDQKTQEDKLKEFAEYYLNKISMDSLSRSFSTIIIPHLDVDMAIGLTDNYYDEIQQKYIIQSIDFSMGENSMKITATNLNQIPTNKYQFQQKIIIA